MIRKILSPLAKVVVTALLLWLLLRKVDVQAAWQAAQNLSAGAFVAALAILAAQLAVCGLRWRMVVRAIGAEIALGKAVAGFAIGMFFGLVLPGAVGGDVVRMWVTHRTGIALATAIDSVILERLATVLALMLLVVVSEPWLAPRMPADTNLWIFPALLALGIAGTAAAMLLDRMPERWTHWRAARGLMRLGADTRALFLHPARAIPVLIVALIGHAMLGLIVYVLARGLGIEIGVLTCIVLFMPVVLVATLPISVAGWGAREVAMVTIFALAGVDAPRALALSILYGILSAIVALPGGFIWLAMPDRRAVPADSGRD